MKTNTFRMLSLTAAVLCAQLASAQEITPAKPLIPAGGAATPAPEAAKPEIPPAKDAVELDLRAFQKAMRTPPSKPYQEMTPLERAQYGEERGMESRQRALAFLSEYPNDPRRWNVISGLYAGSPQFVLKWGEPNADGEVQPAAVDEVAAAAWKARVEGLQAQMKTAADLPEDIKKMFARRAEMEAQQKAFQARWTSGKEKAPDFTTYTLENKAVKISDYRGKVVILDFWASWCGPCKAAMPHVQALAEKYKKQGVVVIGAGTSDKREDFEKFVKENLEKYPNIVWTHDKEERGENRASKALYGVSGIPTQFVIDRKGRVVDVVVGYSKGEVILDGALAKAGIKVDAETLAQAEADLKKRGS